jgi:hypothetical protein
VQLSQLPQAFYFEEGPSGLQGDLTKFRSLAAPPEESLSNRQRGGGLSIGAGAR